MRRDPLDQLRIATREAVAPRREFAEELESRMRRALDVLLVPTFVRGRERPMGKALIQPAITAGIASDDPGRIIRWVRQILGLRVARMWGPEDQPIFAYLSWRTEILSVAVRPSTDNPWSATGPASIGLLATEDEIRAAYDSALAAGAEVIKPLDTHRNPAVPDGYLGFSLRDPEGNFWSMYSRGPTFELADEDADA